MCCGGSSPFCLYEVHVHPMVNSMRFRVNLRERQEQSVHTEQRALSYQLTNKATE